MKRIYAIPAFLLAVAAIFTSCNEEKDSPEDNKEQQQEEIVQPVSLSLTFVLPENGHKAAWEAGDQIVVHGEYAKNQVTVTLAAGDISADGKKAAKTVDGLYPYVREDCKSTLYAAWPAELVDNLPHCFFYSRFTTSNALLMAACNDESNQFAFMELTTAMSFTVDNQDNRYDSYAFTGRKDAVVGYETMQVKITDKETNLLQYKTSPLVTITGPLVAGASSQYVYFPQGIELPSGFELKLFKEGEAKKSLTVKTETTLEQGKDLALGDITSQLKDFQQAIDVTKAVNLAEEGNANCYIVTAPGIYKFPSVIGNSTESVGVVESATVLWETWCNAEAVTEKSLVSSSMYEGGFIYFEVPEPFHPGNALLAALDENENLLWSWHIWMPETPVTKGDYGFMKSPYELMSRNLGALVDTQPGAPADPRSFGLLYQWGRKDPFLGAQEVGSANYMTRSGQGMTTVDGPVADQAAIQSTPLAFVSTSSDWCLTNDNLFWGDLERKSTNPKSVYDPCPAGYRVPARHLGTIFNNAGVTSVAGWNYDAANGVVQVGNPVAVFPVCGYIGSDASLVPSQAIVWDSRNNYEDGGAYSLWLNESSPAGRKTMKRTYGASVRCMTE